MYSNEKEALVVACINSALDKAEEHWRNGGQQLIRKSFVVNDSRARAESAPSSIPGHKVVQDEETVIDEFIALVADMRDSSKHLNCAINAKVSQLQRIFYETSALLPALAMTIKFEEGSVTEYLGDGVLALFRVDKTDKPKAIYAAYEAANNCVQQTRVLVNKALWDRYDLPSIDLGVGLAHSKAIVTLVGLPGEKHPKAFGECVFRATKLSTGKNEIYIDQFVKGLWPTTKGGLLRFILKSRNDVDGYLISK
jgi:class 3 adenylate cyclase